MSKSEKNSEPVIAFEQDAAITEAEAAVQTPEWSEPKEPKEKYLIVNAYDDLVRVNVRSLMDASDMCKCEKCFLDTCALVFNRKYTHFVTTREGALLTKVPEMSHGNHVEMVVTIMEALRMVKNFPKH